jgi:competence protein ComEA
MERYRRLIIILLAVVVAIPVIIKSRQSPSLQAPATFSVMSSVQSYARISGDVRHPGMYSFCANKMTSSVISMAMPLQPRSALEPAGVGAMAVINGETLQLRDIGSGRVHVTRGLIPVSERLVMGIPLDINTMNETDLDKVQGIGPALAKRIVLYRQNNGGWMSVQDLLLVEGIGEKKYDRLRKYF